MSKKVRPQVTGEMQLNRQKIGNVSLWIQTEKENEKFPDLKGQIKAVGADGRSTKDSEVLGYVSLWLRGFVLVPVEEYEELKKAK